MGKFSNLFTLARPERKAPSPPSVPVELVEEARQTVAWEAHPETIKFRAFLDAMIEGLLPEIDTPVKSGFVMGVHSVKRSLNEKIAKAKEIAGAS